MTPAPCWRCPECRKGLAELARAAWAAGEPIIALFLALAVVLP